MADIHNALEQKTDCTVFLFCTVRLNYIQCKEITLILRQQTSGPMPEDGLVSVLKYPAPWQEHISFLPPHGTYIHQTIYLS